MPQLQIIRSGEPRPTIRERLGHAWRSLVLGPWSTKDPALARLFGSTRVHSGVSVNESTALTMSAVWSAVNLIAGHVGALPLILYKRQADGGKSRFDGHPLYRVLHDRPNDHMTSVTFREVLQAHVLLWGNAYAEIERDAGGRPVALWPLLPYSVSPFFPTPNAPLMYRVTNPSGSRVEFDADDIFHLRGLGEDGILGYSVISKARESIGLGLATEQFGAAFFGNGSTFGGVISYPVGAGGSTQTRKENREAIEAIHTGVDRAHRFLALYEGAKYERIGIPPEDAQFLETRQFQITEVARWFNLPPHKLKDLSRATFSNIEHQSIEYVTDTLMPWLRRWEAEVQRKLVSSLEQTQQFAEFLLEGLLRGDAATRATYYKTMAEIGAMTVNEIRRRENLSPIPGGDRLLTPASMQPAGKEPSL